MKGYYIEYNQHNKTTVTSSLEQVNYNFDNIKSFLANKELGNRVRIVQVEDILDLESSPSIIEEQYYQFDHNGNGYWASPLEDFIYSFKHIFDVESDYLFEVETVYVLEQQNKSTNLIFIANDKPKTFVNERELDNLIPFANVNKNPVYFRSIQQLDEIESKMKYSRWNHLRLNINILSLISDNISEKGIEYFIKFSQKTPTSAKQVVR